MRNSYSTEFPTADTATSREFAEIAIDWARRIRDTRIFSTDAIAATTEDDEIDRRSPDGSERLQLKRWRDDDRDACGVRYLKRDADRGVDWVTECVLTVRHAGGSLALRGMCVSLRADAMPELPRKPQLIRLLLDAGFGGEDGGFMVGRDAHQLRFSDHSVNERIRSDGGTGALPVVLASCGPIGMPDRQLKRFAAEDLAGIAHLVRHPSPLFSRRAADRPGPTMPRDGALALALPGRGIVRRYFLGATLKDFDAVRRAVRDDVVAHLDAMGPRLGLDWTSLQDRHASQLRRKSADTARALASADLSRLQSEYDEFVETFDRDLAAKDARIEELENRLAEAQKAAGAAARDMSALPGAEESFGPLYKGELGDRLARILRRSIREDALTERDRKALAALQDAFPSSGKGRALMRAIKATDTDGKRQAARLEEVLKPTGYARDRNNGHPVLVHASGCPSLQPITVHSTPSDRRASRNLASQIINALDLRDL